MVVRDIDVLQAVSAPGAMLGVPERAERRRGRVAAARAGNGAPAAATEGRAAAGRRRRSRVGADGAAAAWHHDVAIGDHGDRPGDRRPRRRRRSAPTSCGSIAGTREHFLRVLGDGIPAPVGRLRAAVCERRRGTCPRPTRRPFSRRCARRWTWRGFEPKADRLKARRLRVLAQLSCAHAYVPVSQRRPGGGHQPRTDRVHQHAPSTRRTWNCVASDQCSLIGSLTCRRSRASGTARRRPGCGPRARSPRARRRRRAATCAVSRSVASMRPM